jgi:hypothetical protein
VRIATTGLTITIALGLLVLPLAACGLPGTGSESGAGAPAQANIPDEAQEVVATTRLDLAEQLGVSVEGIEVIDVKPVDWPDSSLGCPKPDLMYAQTITPGYQVVLESGGEQYVYHTSDSHVVWCDTHAAIEAPDQGTTVDATAAALALQAKQDLGARLGIPAEEVSLISAEAVEWPDASLGCPEAGKMYAQVITPGYLIILAAEGQEYTYHANPEKLVHCDP